MIIRRALAQDANELAEFNSSIALETEGVELISVCWKKPLPTGR